MMSHVDDSCLLPFDLLPIGHHFDSSDDTKHIQVFSSRVVGFEPIWYQSRTIGRKAKALDVPLQNVVHAAGIIDFCEVGKLTVEGCGEEQSVVWL